MNALLVYPEWPDTYWSFKHALPFEGKRSAYPPLGLMTISSQLPGHWKKRLVDTNVKRLTDSDLKWADVVMLSGMLVHRREILDILARCRARGLRTVIGGPITSSVEELPLAADHVVVGEAEEVMPILVADLEAGTAKPFYKAHALPDLSKTPLPDLDLVNLKPYSAVGIQYSRGCPFNCEFCDIIEIYGRRPRTKSPEQIVAELELLHDRKWRGSVFLVDDNFIGNKKKVKELLPVLGDWNTQHGRPFTFFTEASLNLADDSELLEMMKAAGFIRVFLGIETPVEASLKEAQKLQNTRRSLLDSVHHIQSFGIEVMAGFIVGFDNDPDDVFDRQVEALCAPGDVVVGLSTSGKSRNVAAALQRARELGAFTVALTGESGARIARFADVCLRIPSSDVARIQEGHILSGICCANGWSLPCVSIRRSRSLSWLVPSDCKPAGNHCSGRVRMAQDPSAGGRRCDARQIHLGRGGAHFARGAGSCRARCV